MSWKRPLALAFVAVCVLAACGGGGGKRGAAPTSSASSTNGRTSSTTSGSSGSSTSGAQATTSTPPGSTGTTASGGAGSTGPSSSAAAWLTFQHDDRRSGVDADAPGAFGSASRRWTSAETLDGDVYGEPLVVGVRVIVATDHDTAYMLDAATGATVWKRHVAEPVPASDLPCGDIDPIGIVGTPVADTANGLLYLVAFSQPSHHELFALRLADGSVAFHRPVDAPGADPRVHNQRAALALSRGRVYVAFGGRFGDCGDYKGRVVSVPADGNGSVVTSQLPIGRGGGIWSPGGLAIDSRGDVWVATGNTFSTTTYDDGNSVIHLTPDLHAVDTWAPRDWAALNRGDTDLGSLGPTLLDNGLVFIAGKAGTGYLLHAAHLGGVGGEAFSGAVCDGSGAYGGTAFRGGMVFVPCRSGLVAVLVGGDVNRPSFTVAWRGPSFAAGPPVVAGNVVWTIDVSRGVLYALDAASGAVRTRQTIGDVTHFAAPASAGSTVYAAGGHHVVAFAVR